MGQEKFKNVMEIGFPTSQCWCSLVIHGGEVNFEQRGNECVVNRDCPQGNSFGCLGRGPWKEEMSLWLLSSRNPKKLQHVVLKQDLAH